MTRSTAESRRTDEAAVDAFILGQAGETPDGDPADPQASQQQGEATIETETPGDPTQEITASDDQAPDTPTDEELEATFEARYKILRGKYDAEVPRMAAQIKELQTIGSGNTNQTATINDLNTTIADLRAQLAAQPEQASNATFADDPGMEQLREEYGSQLVDGMMGMIKHQVDPLANRVESVSQDQATQSFASFEQAVASVLEPAGIGYHDFNNDPSFTDWLKQPVDELSSVTRQAMLNEAVTKRDVNRASGFFKKYAAGLGAGPQTNSLDEHAQVAGGGAGDPNPGGTGKERWTPAEYARQAALLRNKKITLAAFEDWERNHWPR